MNNDGPHLRRHRIKLAALSAVSVLALASCGAITGSDEAAATEPASTGSVEQLCATADQFSGPLTTAADLSALADAKVGYLEAARVSAPAEWVDNIEIILPAWTTLVEVIEAAGGDPSLIDFDKFRADFADATSNDAALEAFVQSRCTPAG